MPCLFLCNTCARAELRKQERARKLCSATLNDNFNKKTKIQDGGSKMVDPKWRTTLSNFIASYCFSSLYKCFLVTSSLERKKKMNFANIVDILRI